MSDAATGFLHLGMKVHDIERATRCYTAALRPGRTRSA
jgi:hypothetical protein